MIDSIEFSNISFGYESKNQVFDKASFSLPLNSWVIVNGELGSGKSTFVKLLLGLLTPTGGVISYNKEDIHELGFEKFSDYLGNIGHVLDGEGLLSNQSLFENLSLPLIYHKNMGLTEREEWIEYWLKKFNILSHKNDRPAFVTEEVKKIVSILRALILKPEMVLLHNPLNDLSGYNQRRVFEMLDEFEAQHNLKHIIIASDTDIKLPNKNLKTLLLSQGKVNEI